MDEMITNKNEITKGEFEELDKRHNFDKFTPEQVAMTMLSVHSLIKKGETDELSEEETSIIKSVTAEIKALEKYTINDLIEGQIVKSDVYTQHQQVKWLDIIEKSETGEKIEKGIFLDTELNRELERVGLTFEKGKSMKKADEEEAEEKEEDYDEDMMKAAMAYVKKGGEKKDVVVGMKKDYPKGDAAMMKKCITKAYKNTADDYMKKADIEVEISGGDDDDEEEEGKKKNGKEEVEEKGKK